MRALERLSVHAGGFCTEEIREGRRRVGFRINSLDGESGILAHVDCDSAHRVSRYGVNLADIRRVGVAALERALGECELIVVDEIARMELFCAEFPEVVQRCLDSPKPLLGTIQERSDPFLDRIRGRADVRLVPVTRANRDLLPAELVGLLTSPLRRCSSFDSAQDGPEPVEGSGW